MFLFICADARIYCFEDGAYPAFNSVLFKITKLDNNSVVQFGNPIKSENQLRLQLDNDALVTFKWHHDLKKDAGKLVFLAPNIKNPIECHSDGNNSGWDQVSVEVSRGEVEWLLTKLDDIGYLDDLIIEYKGCKVAKFNIYPEDCELNDDKIMYIKLDNIKRVSSAQLELIMPQETKISETSVSGFFCGATLTRKGDIITIAQSNSTEVNSAEIKLSLTNIPYGRHSIQIVKLIINGVDQHPSLYNCKWSLNSNAVCVSAQRESIEEV